MIYKKEDGRITVFDAVDFSPRKITECGQLFRYRRDGDVIKIFAKNCECILKEQDSCVIIDTVEVDFFEKYFDLSTDYDRVRQSLASFSMQNALDFGRGLRILRQDPFETIISFIVSANNNIPRIQGILDKLCIAYGKPRGEGFAFPTAEALAKATEEDIRRLGAGYRAAYIIKAAQMLTDGFDLNLYGVATADAKQRLTALPGVGPKVADCILLFAYHKPDVFPVDTWVKKIYADKFCDDERNVKRMAERLTKTYGNLSGYAQQYLFYYYRNKKSPNL